jgi:hypothetical protein
MIAFVSNPTSLIVLSLPFDRRSANGGGVMCQECPKPQSETEAAGGISDHQFSKQAG